MSLGTFNANGIFDSQLNPANLNEDSFANAILQLFPSGNAPIYAFTGELNRTVAKGIEHGYFTKAMAYSKMTVPSLTVAAATTITVDSTVGVAPYMVFQNQATRENIRILTIASATSVTVTRAFGRVAAADITAGTILIAIGNAQTESSLRPAYRSIKKSYVPNYTMITRNAWAVSDTARASLLKLKKYDNVSENRTDCMEMHSTEIEQGLIWSQAVAPSGDPLLHSTQGIIDCIMELAPANVKTAGATTSYSQLVDLVEPAFAYQSSSTTGKQRTVYCDSRAMKVFHDIGRLSGQVTMTAETTVFGLMFTEFKIYKGMLRLLEHPLLSEMSNDAGIAIIVDLPSMKIAYMEGRDAKREEFDGSKDSTGSGIDAVGGSLTTEFATEFQAPPTFGLINGLTQGVA